MSRRPIFFSTIWLMTIMVISGNRWSIQRASSISLMYNITIIFCPLSFTRSELWFFQELFVNKMFISFSNSFSVMLKILSNRILYHTEYYQQLRQRFPKRTRTERSSFLPYFPLVFPYQSPQNSFLPNLNATLLSDHHLPGAFFTMWWMVCDNYT